MDCPTFIPILNERIALRAAFQSRLCAMFQPDTWTLKASPMHVQLAVSFSITGTGYVYDM